MRFGRTRQSVIDPPKKRKKEFTDYDEYQQGLRCTMTVQMLFR